MSFTVTDLLASKQFSDMHLVNDNCNVNAEIKRIRIIEVSDMEHFLIGGGCTFTDKLYSLS